MEKQQQMKADFPIVVLDIETTSADIPTCRMIQFAAVKLTGAYKQTLKRLIDPEIEISEEATAVHGITNADLEQYGTFEDFSEDLYKFLEGGNVYVAGYRSHKFDIPIIVRQFKEIGVDIEFKGQVDAYVLFKDRVKHTLETAHRYYTGEPFENAHDALADVEATARVLRAQVKEYGIETIADLVKASAPDPYDYKVIEKDGVLNVAFGKYKDQPLDVMIKDRNYCSYILGKDFPDAFKDLIRERLKG